MRRGASFAIFGLLFGIAGCEADNEAPAFEGTQRNSSALDGDCLDASCCPAGLTPLEGTAGGDLLFPNAPDQCVLGKEGGDLIIPTAGHAERLVVIGGPGGDQLHSPSVSAELYGGSDGDNIYGSPHDDVIDAGPGADQAFGYGGGDEVRGGEGDDILHGGAGPDDVSGGEGDDTIYGDQDNLGNTPAEDVLSGDAGDDTIVADGGNDTVEGGTGDDHIEGGEGDDTLAGGLGVDDIDGGPGDDILLVRHACEVSVGDTLEGGPGFDTVESPYTQAQLELLGVVVSGVESFTIVPEDPTACPEPPPTGWDIDPATGSRLRPATPFEILANDWVEGSWLVERELQVDVQGNGVFLVPRPGAEPAAIAFERSWSEEGMIFTTEDLGSGATTFETPTIEVFRGEVDGTVKVAITRTGTGHFTGHVSDSGFTYATRRMRPSEFVDPALPSSGPVTLLQPSVEGPVTAAAGDPKNLATLPGAVVYRVGYVGEGGFCEQNPGDEWMDVVADYVVNSREAFLLATQVAPNRPWLLGSFAHCYRFSGGSHQQCTRDLVGGYSQGDPGDQTAPIDPTLLPITETGIPLIDTADSPLPSSCRNSNGRAYPFADCGQPGIAMCVRDRGWTAFNQLKSSGVLPPAINPDLIQSLHEAVEEPPGNGQGSNVSARRGMYGWLLTGTNESREFTGFCGFAWEASLPDSANLPWRLPNASECSTLGLSSDCSCQSCDPLPTGATRERLSAVSVATEATGLSQLCATIIGAHEFTHNFDATHETISATAPPGWETPGCTSGTQGYMRSGLENTQCLVPRLGGQNLATVNACAGNASCPG